MLNSADLLDCIKKRRSIFPSMYNDVPISKDELWKILEAANWAPNHKNTEPWRFIVFQEEAKNRLGNYLQSWYKENTSADKFSDSKYKKTAAKTTKSSAIIAIIMHRDENAQIPEWEELAAVACSVQNMWLLSTAMGIGAYWSSPKSAIEGDAFFELKENEQCLGLFYMGKYDHHPEPPIKGAVEKKVRWLLN